YKYLPFERGTQQIRLFCIENVNSLGDPEGRLEHFTHNSAPPYQALSYTWGAETPTYRLPIVDTTNSKGHGLEIRKNLSSFLRVFGKKHPRKWIWIDQLCINQDDLAERNDQVQRMGEIYSKASEVLI
ncbi:heterokaryon incompatibility protein-domain-containing protein, partial [Tricladium varicosporioides]